MSIFDRLNRALEGWRTTPETLVESDGARVDRLMSSVGRSVETLETNASLTDLIKEDQGWYRVQALNATLDIGEQERTVIQRLALYFNTNSPLAVHMLDAVTSHVIGGCVQFNAKNEDLKRALKEFWDDPDNHMSEDAIKFGREFIGNGELALPIFPGANTGLLKLGYIHPLNIKEIKTDPNNSRKFTELIERAKPGEDDKVWTIVNGDVTPADILAAGKNYLLYFPLQRWAIARGRPLLESSYYWIHHIQQFLGDRVKINAFLKAWSWWIKMTGADATQVNAKITQMSGGLPPGGLYVSNDEEELTPLSPSINAGDAIPDLIALLKYAAHSCSLPAHWIGAADDVNRSTADSASDPTIRFLEVLQKQVMEGVFLRMLNLQRDLFIESGYIPALKDDEMEITIEQPDLTPSDNQKKADAVAKVTSALVLAIENKLTDLGTGQTLWHNTAGMEVPENLDNQIQEDMTEDVLGVYKSTPTPEEVAAAAAKLNAPPAPGQNGNGKAQEAYNPNQPRVPSGEKGGEWTSGGGGISVDGEPFVMDEYVSDSQKAFVLKNTAALKTTLVKEFPEAEIRLQRSDRSEAAYYYIDPRTAGEFDSFSFSIRNHINPNAPLEYDHAFLLSDEKYSSWNDLKADVMSYVSEETGLKPAGRSGRKWKSPLVGIAVDEKWEFTTGNGYTSSGVVLRVSKSGAIVYKGSDGTHMVEPSWIKSAKKLE